MKIRERVLIFIGVQVSKHYTLADKDLDSNAVATVRFSMGSRGVYSVSACVWCAPGVSRTACVVGCLHTITRDLWRIYVRMRERVRAIVRLRVSARAIVRVSARVRS